MTAVSNPSAGEVLAELKKFSSYDPETGLFICTVQRISTGKYRVRKSKIKPGKVFGFRVGHCEPLGMQVAGKLYGLHRLAWLWAYGKWPENEIDHINGDPTDNRLVNLRDVSRTLNQRNQRKAKNNTSGVIGVCWHSRIGRRQARIGVGGKRLHLGYHASIAAAAKAREVYLASHQELGYTKRHGKE